MNDDLQKKLAGVRADIDRIDGELLNLLNKRARCAQRVGEIKAAHGEAGHIYRPEREAQVLRRLQEANPGPLPGENVTFFFREASVGRVLTRRLPSVVRVKQSLMLGRRVETR